MSRDLGGHDVGDRLFSRSHHGGGGFIAGAFDAEDVGVGHRTILLELHGRLAQTYPGQQISYPDRLIHLFIGGSELHGAKVQGTDDLDIYGVYVEPPEMILGLEDVPHFVWSTAGDDRRNGPHDVDITLYSLKKWAALACKGNPTALHFLFAEGELRERDVGARCFKQTSIRCTGFRKAIYRLCKWYELGRLTGKKGRGKKGQRPEIEAKYGYDVKAAMHSLRLLYECKEFILDGHITLPRPERDFLIRVRTGKYPLEKVVRMANELYRNAKSWLERPNCLRSWIVVPYRRSCPNVTWKLGITVERHAEGFLHLGNSHTARAGLPSLSRWRGCVRDLLLGRGAERLRRGYERYAEAGNGDFSRHLCRRGPVRRGAGTCARGRRCKRRLDGGGFEIWLRGSGYVSR